MDLPALNEGDETVSLADILVARDSCLTEDELWALCRECCLVLEVVNNSPEMFQTLCVTPDTVAFDQMGNVCFLDLEVDPEPIYIPPEYDNVGNSYKAHLFSLGMTLLYAAEYNADSSKSDINIELRDLLGRMTLENYSTRPDLDSVILLCEEQLCGQSSQEVCCTIAQFSGFPHPEDEDVSSKSITHIPDDTDAYAVSDSDLTQSGEGNRTLEDISQASVYAQFSEPGDSQPSCDSDSDMDKRSHRKVSPQVINGLWVSSTPSKSKSKLKSVDDKYCSENSSTRKGSATSADVLESDVAVTDLYNEYSDNVRESKPRKSSSGNNLAHEDQMSNSGKHSDISSSRLSQNGLDEVFENDNSESKQNKFKRKESIEKSDSLLQSIDGSDVSKKGSNEVESSDSSSLTTSKKKKKRSGLTIGEVLNAVDRFLEEEELWALCKEGIASLQRKKKHLPAYLSPDTIFLRENGTLSFKAIPEEKPLEVIFMAPELQSNGELSEKTCLYGLSVTLRCVSGKKYSSISSMLSSQELKDLLESLAESNPNKRPNLADIAELCAKQEIRCGKKSSVVCQKIFQEAVDVLKVNSRRERARKLVEQEETEGKENESNQYSSQIEKENKSGISAINSSAQEYSMPVLAKPSAIKPSAIKPNAFKPVAGSAFQSVNGGSFGSDSGAFQPIPKKSQQKERVEEPRLPSAFSSPATHFKPIVLHQPEPPKDIKVESSKKEESAKKESTSKRKDSLNQPNDKDKEVFKKLDELKKNLMKHGRQPNMAKEIENEDLADSPKSSKESTSKSSTPSKPKTKSRKSDRMSVRDQAPNGALETLLKEIQKQGHVPDTQSLANTIAQYLQSQLGQRESERAQSKSSDTKSITSEQNIGEVSNQQSPNQNTPIQGQLPQGMLNQFSNLNIPAQYQPQLVGQTMTLPMQCGGNVFPGYTQVQLQQDPITGFFNLVPVNFMPVSSHGNQGHDSVSIDSVVKLGRSSPLMSLEVDHAGNYGKSKTLGHGRTAKDLLQRTANIRAKNLGRLPGPDLLSVQSENAGLWRSKSDYALDKSDSAFYSDREGNKQSFYSSQDKHAFGAVNNHLLVDVHNRTHQSLSPHAIPPYDPNSQEPRLYRTHSNSSSPSPSKDSGVSGMNIGYKNVPSGMEASLMDRLLSNVNIKQQKMLGKIVNLLRDEFAFDGYMENGVEDLAMAEYIASLGMLKWDTFISAISEKYSDLYWNPELLVNLYEAVNGAKPTVHDGSRSNQQHSGTSRRAMNPNLPMRNKLHTRQHLQEDFDSSSMSESSDHRRSVRNAELLHSLIPTGDFHGRPQSVHALGQHVDTSDSTDTEQYEKRRKLKKKYQLDRVKSSSMHNLLSESSYSGHININIQGGNIAVAKTAGNIVAQFGQEKDMVNHSNGTNSLPNQWKSMEPDLTSTPNAKRSSDSGQILDISVRSQTESGQLTLFNTTNMNQNERLKIDAMGLNEAKAKPKSMLLSSTIPSAPPTLTVTSSTTLLLDSERGSVSTLDREMSISSQSSSQSGVRNYDNGSIDTVAKTPVKHKGHVVYHWAMIQLSMTPEVERFMQDIDEENAKMLDSRLSSIEQQIKMEKKVRRKTQSFYKKLHESTAKSAKGDKNTLTQVVKDITDMTHRISFLELCKTHLEMLQAELQGIDVSYLYSIATSSPGSPMQLRPRPDNPLLQFQTLRETTSGCEIQALHAGTPEGLMAYLFASTALNDGYIHQFLFCFRYFAKAEDVLNFLIDRFISSQMAEGNEVNLCRLQQRVIDFFHFWLEGYYSIDFEKNPDLLATLENFFEDKISPDSESYKTLTALLSNCRHGHNLELSTADTSEQEIHFWQREEKHKWESFKSLVRGKSHTSKDRPGHTSSGGTVCIERRRHSLTLTREELFHPKVMRRTDTFTLIDYSAQVLAEQLTLIQQGMFQLAHPVQYLDSKSRGIGVEMAQMGLRTPSLVRANRDSSQNVPEVETRSLFVSLRVDSPVIKQMIEHSQQISHWVAAEVVTCSNAKSQVIVLTRILQTAQICMELRNFATCISILDGLENVIVKQLPAWKNLSNKCLSIMEELSALKMVLKNDPLSLMQHVKDCHLYPTIPSILLFLLHVQQLEIGGFQFANQMFKWGKIRSLAQVIDQIRIFREHVYCFEAKYELQDTLQHRIRELCRQEIHVIAAQNDFNFQKLTGGGISGALRKVRGKFQLKTDR